VRETEWEREWDRERESERDREREGENVMTACRAAESALTAVHWSKMDSGTKRKGGGGKDGI
jgi:hypothetical protein